MFRDLAHVFYVSFGHGVVVMLICGREQVARAFEPELPIAQFAIVPLRADCCPSEKGRSLLVRTSIYRQYDFSKKEKKNGTHPQGLFVMR